MVPQRVVLEPRAGKPGLRAAADGRSILASHAELGDYTLEIGPGPDGTRPTLLFCENETNRARIDGVPTTTPYPKDGINDHVVGGAADGQPGRRRHEGRALVPAGRAGRRRRPSSGCGCQAARTPGRARGAARTAATAEAASGNGKAAARRRAHRSARTVVRVDDARREAEADEFYEDLRREGGTDDEQRIMRQAFAGMLWSKQYYGYNVARWLDGDPGLPPPPPERKTGRNADWRHFDAADILSMPDPVGVPVVRGLGPRVPRGHARPHRPGVREVPAAAAVPRVVPAPGRGAAGLRVVVRRRQPAGPRRGRATSSSTIDGRTRLRVPAAGSSTSCCSTSRGGSTARTRRATTSSRAASSGLDNIGAFDRSHLPAGTELEQSDATAWMFLYCLNMLRIATVLSEEDPAYEDFQTTFMEHAVRIAAAMNRSGLWDETDGFFYDALKLADGSAVPIKVHSMVGLIPLLPVGVDPGADGPPRPGARQAVRQLHGGRCTSSGERLRGGRLHHRSTRSREPPAQRRPAGPAGQAAAARCCPRTRSCRRTGCGRCRSGTSTQPFKLELGGPDGAGRLRARRIDVGAVRRQLELARPGLDADQLPGHRVALELGFVHGRRLPGRVPDRLRATQVRLRDVAEDIARRLVSIWLPRRERPPARVRGVREVPDRPGLARPAAGSTSTSTATPGPGSAPRTRPAGPGIVAHLLCRGGLIDAIESGRSTARMGTRADGDRLGRRQAERRTEPMDAETLSRVQFALTASFHFIFPPLSMGLGLMLVIIGVIYVRTKDPKWRRLSFFWVKVYGLIFARRRRHRHRPGIRVRHELGRLLAVRRQRLRQPARGRGRVRVLPRGRLPRPDAVRRQPARAAAVAVLDLHGRLRGALQRALDPDGQLVDADARRATRSSTTGP